MFTTRGIASGMVLVLAGLVAADLVAQEQKRGRRGGIGFRGRNTLISLAASEPVQQELGITGEAKAKVDELADKVSDETREQLRDAFTGDFQNLTAEDRQRLSDKMAEISRAMNAKYAPQLKEILKPEQFTRLQQISWQAGGSQALADPELAKQLNLSQEQLDKIAEVNRDYAKKQGELVASSFGGGNQNFQEFMSKSRELTQQRDKAAGDVLNKDQQSKLAELRGKPFDLTQLRAFGGRRQRDN